MIGIAADRGLTAEAAQEAEAAVAKILAEVARQLSGDPVFYLLLQLPATLRGMGDCLVQAFAADIVAMEESVALGLGALGGPATNLGSDAGDDIACRPRPFWRTTATW